MPQTQDTKCFAGVSAGKRESQVEAGILDKLLEQIAEARAQAMDAARPEAVASAHREGRLTARERLAELLDPDSFIEYGALAGETSNVDDTSAADGLVAGAGRIAGAPVVAASYDRSVRNGTQSERNQRKLGRLIYLANTHRWPFICFVDGDGARPGEPLPPPPIIVATRGRWDLYDGLAELSGWAPTVAIVSGRALDGNAGIAMLSDCVIATRAAQLGSMGASSSGMSSGMSSGVSSGVSLIGWRGPGRTTHP